MAKKKSSIKKSKSFNFKTLSIIFGILFFGTVISWKVYVDNTALSYQEAQELQAFEGLAKNYIYNQFEIVNERTATVTNFGVTDDNDLYADFTITKYKDRIPISTQPARLHFQCNGKTDRASGCAHAYWYGEEVETSEESREKMRYFFSELDRLVDAYNSAETDEERERIEKEEASLANEYKEFFLSEFEN